MSTQGLDSCRLIYEQYGIARGVGGNIELKPRWSAIMLLCPLWQLFDNGSLSCQRMSENGAEDNACGREGSIEHRYGRRVIHEGREYAVSLPPHASYSRNRKSPKVFIILTTVSFPLKSASGTRKATALPALFRYVLRDEQSFDVFMQTPPALRNHIPIPHHHRQSASRQQPLRPHLRAIHLAHLVTTKPFRRITLLCWRS